jgi:hypothetical protein
VRKVRRASSLVFSALFASWSSLAQAAVPACPPKPTDATLLADSEADFVVSLSLRSLEDSKLGRELLALAALDLQAGEWLRLKKKCFPAGQRGEALELSVAGAANGQFVWTLQGAGVATEAKLACVSDWFSRRDQGVTPWNAARAATGACIRVYRSSSSRGLGALALENHTLVLVSEGWMDAALSGLEGAEPRALDLDEAALLSRDSSAQIWAAATLHRRAGYLSQVPWRDTVRNLALRAELNDGLSVRVAVATSDFAAALTRAVAEELPRVFADWSELGVPHGLLAKLQVSRAAELFLARWELDERELRQLAKAITAGVRGGGLL